MATYKEIQEFIKDKYDCSVKTCWIADMKEKSGIPTRSAPNRLSRDERVNPCPEVHKEKILEAFIQFKMFFKGESK